jgi:hypothetical protein
MVFTLSRVLALMFIPLLLYQQVHRPLALSFFPVEKLLILES